jgi:hypothetical protein
MVVGQGKAILSENPYHEIIKNVASVPVEPLTFDKASSRNNFDEVVHSTNVLDIHSSWARSDVVLISSAAALTVPFIPTLSISTDGVIKALAPELG